MDSGARSNCEAVVRGNIKRADGSFAPLGEVVPVAQGSIKSAFVDFWKKCKARETATITRITRSDNGFALSQETVTTGRGAGGGRGGGRGRGGGGGRGGGRGGSR